MISICRCFEWDMGHRVTNHKSLCKNLHGHRYKMYVEISGNINNKNKDPEQGMVIDFGRIKEIVSKDIVDKYDHSFMYWSKDEVIAKFACNNEGLRFIRVPFVPTVECIVGEVARILCKRLREELPGVTLESITLYETPNCFAKWTRD